MKILVDAMGGDNAPLCVLQGVSQAAAEFGDGMELVLLGEEKAIRDCAKENKIDLAPFEIVNCTENIDMHDDPVKAVYTLRDYIVHTHAKDGRKLKDNDPEVVYGVIEDAIQEGQTFIELPLGEGDVDFPRYIAALEEVGYRGYLTVEREVGEDPEADIRLAVEFLKKLTR